MSRPHAAAAAALILVAFLPVLLSGCGGGYGDLYYDDGFYDPWYYDGGFYDPWFYDGGFYDPWYYDGGFYYYKPEAGTPGA